MSELFPDIPAPPEPTRKRPKPGERREQILQTLAAMLEKPVLANKRSGQAQTALC